MCYFSKKDNFSIEREKKRNRKRKREFVRVRKEMEMVGEERKSEEMLRIEKE